MILTYKITPEGQTPPAMREYLAKLLKEHYADKVVVLETFTNGFTVRIKDYDKSE